MRQRPIDEDVRKLGLSAKDRLRPRAGVEVHFDSDGLVGIRFERGYRTYSGRVLRILDEFSGGRSIGDVLEVFGRQAAGQQDWLEIWATIVRMHADGVLIRDDEQPDANGQGYLKGFSSPASHIPMLNDRARTDAFLAAIRQTVEPGDVVVDLGTGTGVLALAAARAGAEQVYSIESGDIADAARGVIRANGFQDKVEVIEGWSNRVRLDRRADVLTTETIGNHTFGEQIIESVVDARSRHLRPDAAIIPRVVHVCAVPVELPDAEWAMHVFTHAAVEEWSEWFGFTFEELVSYGVGVPRCFFSSRNSVRGWTPLADSRRLLSVDLQTNETTDFETTTEIGIRRGGLFSAVVVYSEIDVAPGVTLSVDPWMADGPTNWSIPVWLNGRACEVIPGDCVEVKFRYPQRSGLVTWNLKTRERK